VVVVVERTNTKVSMRVADDEEACSSQVDGDEEQKADPSGLNE